jgi:hypothetical protein
MTKNWTLVLAAFALTGCSDFTSPQGVIGTAYTALTKENPKLFKKTLTGEAKARYGSLEGMVELRKLLDGRRALTGKVELVKTDRDGRGWDHVRYYTVDVLGSRGAGDATKVLTADVECQVRYTRNHIDFPHHHGYPHGGRYPYYYGDISVDADFALHHHHYRPFYDESVYCKISRLN